MNNKLCFITAACMFSWMCLNRLNAQTCCSAGAPLTSSFDISTISDKKVIFQLEFDYKSINRLTNGNEVLVNDPRNRNGANFIFKSDIILSDHFAVSALLPFVIQNRKTTSQEESSRGIGDIVLLGQYTLFLEKDFLIKFSGGLKLPTGQLDHSDQRNIFLSPDMQSGSGTLDVISRIGISKNHFLVPNLTAKMGLLYRSNSANQNFGGSNNAGGRRFKFGNEILASWTLMYQSLIGQSFFVPDVGIKYRFTQPNQEQNVKAPNSGGQWWNLSTGMAVAPSDSYSFRAFIEFPIYQQLSGLQISTNLEFGLQINYSI